MSHEESSWAQQVNSKRANPRVPSSSNVMTAAALQNQQQQASLPDIRASNRRMTPPPKQQQPSAADSSSTDVRKSAQQPQLSDALLAQQLTSHGNNNNAVVAARRQSGVTTNRQQQQQTAARVQPRGPVRPAPPESSVVSLPPITGRRRHVDIVDASSQQQQVQRSPQDSEPERIVTSRHKVDPDGTGYETAPELGCDAPPTERRKKGKGRIKVMVRKRPLGTYELGSDIISCNNPSEVTIKETKIRVDLTEYVDSHSYEFDRVFSETDRNGEVYTAVAGTLMDTVMTGRSASCFAYGQTGSGKTFTMIGTDSEPGLYELAARELFSRVQEQHQVYVSLYEIYCNSLFDLLNGRMMLQSREDGNKRINICGLTYHPVKHAEGLMKAVSRGTNQRRTGTTGANEHSSRSHAILQITIRSNIDETFGGCLNLVDLAGSERAADTSGTDKITRMEGAEINKSLLALKECIRGLDEHKKHIPFRGSKLTEVLRDAFVGNSRTVMIATVSPSSLNAEHTLNTLRYAYRVKGLSIERTEPAKERTVPVPQRRCKSESRRSSRIGNQPTPPPGGPLAGDVTPPLTEKKQKHHHHHNAAVSVKRQKDPTVKDVPEASPPPSDVKKMVQEMQYMRTLKEVDDERIRLLEFHNATLQKRIQRLEEVICSNCRTHL